MMVCEASAAGGGGTGSEDGAEIRWVVGVGKLRGLVSKRVDALGVSTAGYFDPSASPS